MKVVVRFKLFLASIALIILAVVGGNGTALAYDPCQYTYGQYQNVYQFFYSPGYCPNTPYNYGLFQEVYWYDSFQPGQFCYSTWAFLNYCGRSYSG